MKELLPTPQQTCRAPKVAAWQPGDLREGQNKVAIHEQQSFVKDIKKISQA
jgi:hypothetical protein